MRILLTHNIYKQAGGEESVSVNEKDLLTQHGHECDAVVLNNHHIQSLSQKIHIATTTPWSAVGYEAITKAIKLFKPAVVHAHNFFPLLTPAIYDACIEAGVPVVQTLHNYRTTCAGALLLRNGKICEKCINGSPYHAVFYRCYRNSVAGSWAVARMVAYHRKRKTWQNKVDRFIALTQFAKQKFVSAGFPEKKIAVKPNFVVQKSGVRSQNSVDRQGALFVGRMSMEKGVATLLAAWQGQKIQLRLAGDGPLMEKLNSKKNPFVEFLGKLDSHHVSSEMEHASFLLMPSEWYEGFPMVIAEAFAHSLPVIASRLGSMAEIVENGVTGLHFEAGNSKDLAEKVMWMHNNPTECRRMGENARREYEAKYTPERNYKMLMDIYEQAIEEKRSSENIRKN